MMVLRYMFQTALSYISFLFSPLSIYYVLTHHASNKLIESMREDHLKSQLSKAI
jgi:hypothetical protein